MRLVLLGGGGHASDVLAALEALSERVPVIGLVADVEVDMRRFHGRGARQIGTTTDLARIDASHYISCVGYPAGRRTLAELADAAGLQPFTVIHPRAWVPPTATVGCGCVVLANSCLSPLARLGDHVLIGQGAIVGHDCVVGSYASVMPGAAVSGDTTLGEGCVIGANSTVIEKRAVGEWATVGAGAVVSRDIPPHVIAKGVPARF
jgi:sugar O-acyltransferase (sialic acid O-acetyltransferase NeuD family)